MSVADHFYHKLDAGFVREYDALSARRQFQVSLILILVLAAAAVVLGILSQLDRPWPQADSASSHLNNIKSFESLLAFRS
jgi:hypothetical protein